MALDLLLQRLPAYRHVLFNSGLRSYSRLGALFVLAAAYFRWMQLRNPAGPEQEEGRESGEELYQLEWRFYQSLAAASLEAGVFVASLVSELRLCGWEWRGATSALLASFYGNVFLAVCIVWRLYASPPYILLIQIFILLSHLQVLRALRDLCVWKALAMVAVAKTAQILTALAANKWLLSPM